MVAGTASKRRASSRRRKARLHDQPRKPIELNLTGFAAGGRALGRAPDGRVVFVEYGIPGERVLAEITAEDASYIEATTITVLEPAPSRVEPRCGYFGRCGGCQLQHIDYPAQLELKTGVVAEQLRRIGRFEDATVLPTLGMDDPWGYRNHLRFTVRRDGEIGYMQRGTHRFLRIDRCEIAHPRVNEILVGLQGRTMQTAQVSVRIGEHTGDVLVQPKLQWRPGRRANIPSGQRYYREALNEVSYRISSPAFFQVNTREAEHLVDLVIERVAEVNPRAVVDAYAGVGTFAAQLAASVDEVITIEWSAAAGDDADVNLGKLSNVTRLVGSVEDILPTITTAPDVLVVDPPRAGLERPVINTVVASGVRRLVYVSCEPATLARDLRLLVDGGFTLVDVQPVDMFPHTQHVECVAVLDRAGARLA